MTQERTLMDEQMHYTAWLTVDPSVARSGYAEIDVVRDEPDDGQGWTCSGEPAVMQATTDVRADGDHGESLRSAETILANDGWWIIGDWESVESGYAVEVLRA